MDIENYVNFLRAMECAIEEITKDEKKEPANILVQVEENKIKTIGVKYSHIYDMTAMDPTDRKAIVKFATRGATYYWTDGKKGYTLWLEELRPWIGKIIADYIYDVLIQRYTNDAADMEMKEEYTDFMIWVLRVMKKSKPDIKSIFDDIRKQIDVITKNLQVIEKEKPRIGRMIRYMQEGKDSIPEIKETVRVDKAVILRRYIRQIGKTGTLTMRDIELDKTIKDLGDVPEQGTDVTAEMHARFDI